MPNGTFLRSARARERAAGVDFRELACYAGKLTPYVQSQLSAALLGLEKLYLQIPTVALPEEVQREAWEDFRPEYIREIRVALDLIAASLTAVGCTEEELTAAYLPGIPEADDMPPEADDSEGTPEVERTLVFPVPVLSPGDAGMEEK